MKRGGLKRKRYFAELNRAIGDSIQVAKRKLERQGVNCETLSHKTALVIERPANMPWPEFTKKIRSVIHPRRGSVMMSSEATGRTFICQNRGNRPGKFIQQ
jgi:hypothetical protein